MWQVVMGNAFSRYLSSIASLVSLMVMSNYLGAELRGEFAYLHSITFLILGIVLLSAHNAIHSESINYAPESVLSFLVRLVFFAAVIVCFYDHWRPFYITESISLSWFGATFFLLAVEWVVIQLLTYRQEYKHYNVALITFAILQLVLFLTSQWLEFGLQAFLVAFVISKLIYLLIYIKRFPELLDFFYVPRRRDIILLLKTAIPLHLGVVGVLLLSQIDVVMISFLTNAMATVGQYQVATQFLGVFYFVAQAFSMYFLGEQNKSNAVDAWSWQKRRIVQLFVVMVGLVICAYLLAPLIFSLLFNEEFSEVAGIFQILLIGVPIMVLKLTLESQVIARDMTLVLSLFTFLAVLLNMTLNWWWIPLYGANGAAYAMIVSQSLYVAYVVFIYTRINVKIS